MVNMVKTNLDTSEIFILLSTLNIHAAEVHLMQHGAKNQSFRIDERYLLRLSRTPFDDAASKYLRAESIPYAASHKHTGSFESKSGLLFYMVTDYFLGEDLFDSSAKLSVEQQLSLGKKIAEFLANLHSKKGRYYDIGHYVPTIPQYKGSWREGHQAYNKYLRTGIKRAELTSKSRDTISESLSYIDKNIDCLEFQNGPRLLHNDFHPKNIIVHDGKLSGIIDWECSQYGEPDFDLSHIIHWCLFPPDADVDLNPFLYSFLLHSPLRNEVSELSTRLTIYQIEHEINQLIWHNGDREDDRCLRITEWLSGRIDLLLHEIEINQG